MTENNDRSILPLENYKRHPKAWGGYVLECEYGRIYVGMGSNLDRRLREHMRGNGCPFTSRHKPLRLVELYFCKSKQEAETWERETIKQLQKTRGVKFVGGVPGVGSWEGRRWYQKVKETKRSFITRPIVYQPRKSPPRPTIP